MVVKFLRNLRYVWSLLSVRTLLCWDIRKDISRKEVGENVDLAGAYASASFKLQHNDQKSDKRDYFYYEHVL
jgi:hypothetical protein